MKKILLLLLLTACAFSQDKPQPKLTDAAKLEVREAQVELQQSQIQLLSLEAQYREAQDKLKAASEKLRQAIIAAFQQAGANQDDWQLSPKLELIPTAKKPQQPSGKK